MESLFGPPPPQSLFNLKEYIQKGLALGGLDQRSLHFDQTADYFLKLHRFAVKEGAWPSSLDEEQK